MRKGNARKSRVKSKSDARRACSESKSDARDLCVKRTKKGVKEKALPDNGTIFDDVFRSMQERHPRLLVPLVNEAFGEELRPNEEVTRLPEGYQKIESKVILDSCNMIRNNIYHFECQSGPDGTMVLRMVEYDFVVARGSATKVDNVYRMKFPKSCVVYLRSGRNAGGKLMLDIELMDGKVLRYEVPVIRICDYTLDEILEKKLYIYLPFYIMRYEGELGEIGDDEERTRKLEEEFVMITERLRDELGDLNDGTYQDMMLLMRRVMNHELRNEDKLSERMSGVMGGKVLQMPSDALIEARADGERTGYERGVSRLNQLFEKLDALGRLEDYKKSISDGNYQAQLFKEFGI